MFPLHPTSTSSNQGTLGHFYTKTSSDVFRLHILAKTNPNRSEFATQKPGPTEGGEMENRNKAVCPENEEVAAYLLNKRQELAQSAKGISENMDMTLSKAYSNVCNCKTPIKTLRDLSQIKGVGKWILKQMKGFFKTDSGSSENDELPKKGKFCNTGDRKWNEFMRKQELIDAAETSGLSRVPIAPEKAKGKAGHFGSSPRDWYSGWNCMKTLVSRGLVVKSSCPAKYMLTEEGKEVARECLLRSNINDANKSLDGVEGCPNFNQRKKSRVDVQGDPDLECIDGALVENAAVINLKKPKISIDVPAEYLDKKHPRERRSSLWPSVLCRLREDDIYGSTSVPKSMTDDHYSTPSSDQHSSGQAGLYAGENIQQQEIAASSKQKSTVHDFAQRSCTLKACSSTRCGLKKMIYLVEGDPNSSEAAESIKTACFTTEILEGFDVQRTSGLADTLKKYGYLTRSINQYYKSLDPEQKFAGVCPPFDEFIRTCEELDKMTVSDVFAVQLMQVPQVTEDIALAVLDMYPTLVSLARAYSLLDGDVCAQEEMLKRQSNNLINGSASKNIFHLVWGS
ncbi:Crossover junction endonuclease MUS81 [Sesamum angolense]|uniref:Crossover junction endonuclease MUS81 n=1 Tax=Sesamum angolense TaxID=2727404 RepID=A0AAE1X6V8_9LAMI|nr:Crossover junction endonuclease MUS81 [Sesamum angolense]